MSVKVTDAPRGAVSGKGDGRKGEPLGQVALVCGERDSLESLYARWCKLTGNVAIEGGAVPFGTMVIAQCGGGMPLAGAKIVLPGQLPNDLRPYGEASRTKAEALVKDKVTCTRNKVLRAAQKAAQAPIGGKTPLALARPQASVGRGPGSQRSNLARHVQSRAAKPDVSPPAQQTVAAPSTLAPVAKLEAVRKTPPLASMVLSALEGRAPGDLQTVLRLDGGVLGRQIAAEIAKSPRDAAASLRSHTNVAEAQAEIDSAIESYLGMRIGGRAVAELRGELEKAAEAAVPDLAERLWMGVAHEVLNAVRGRIDAAVAKLELVRDEPAVARALAAAVTELPAAQADEYLQSIGFAPGALAGAGAGDLAAVLATCAEERRTVLTYRRNEVLPKLPSVFDLRTLTPSAVAQFLAPALARIGVDPALYTFDGTARDLLEESLHARAHRGPGAAAAGLVWALKEALNAGTANVGGVVIDFLDELAHAAVIGDRNLELARAGVGSLDEARADQRARYAKAFAHGLLGAAAAPIKNRLEHQGSMSWVEQKIIEELAIDPMVEHVGDEGGAAASALYGKARASPPAERGARFAARQAELDGLLARGLLRRHHPEVKQAFARVAHASGDPHLKPLYPTIEAAFLAQLGRDVELADASRKLDEDFVTFCTALLTRIGYPKSPSRRS